jgi:hypothetical protein
MANQFIIKNGLVVNSGGISLSSGDLSITGSMNVSENLIVEGTITAQEFNTEYVSSSIVFSSGSTKFGDTSDDSHDFTGSINVNGEINVWNASDPKVTLTTQGGDAYSLGVDDSDSDKFKISRSTSVGTNPIYTYNYNGGSPQTLIQGDLSIPSTSQFSGGELVKINPSGFLVAAVANTDYVPTGSTPDIYVLNSVTTYVDFKSNTTGALPWGGIVDVAPINLWFGVWIAPADGYIEKIYVSPENTNTTTDQLSIQLYKNGSTQGSAQSELMGSPGNNVEYTFGPVSYSFSAGDRISLYLNKNTNTSDFYAFQVVFRLGNN